jgi:hypothetical protein
VTGVALGQPLDQCGNSNSTKVSFAGLIETPVFAPQIGDQLAAVCEII